MRRPALLALADGSVFRGHAIGASGSTVGEVVFNTAITGYQEILTDPSYAQQIVTLTHPHIGNTGVNDEDNESSAIWAAGLVVRDVPPRVSNWRAQGDLESFLIDHDRVAISGVDTRRLTRRLRDSGSQAGCVLAGDPAAADDAEATAIAAARGFPGLAGADLAKVVSTTEPYEWHEAAWSISAGYAQRSADRFHVVALDYGVKRNILRMLAARDCRLTVVPAETDLDAVMALQPDGLLLSNGPGDPEPCGYAIEMVRRAFAEQQSLPMFGICLGYQIMALASGARSLKMSHGHHGANHPIQDLRTKQVLITSQNHGFAVDIDTLPDNVVGTHVSLFDGTLQGIRRTDRPAFGVQGHPEASPGPHDLDYLFDQFIDLMAGTTNA